VALTGLVLAAGFDLRTRRIPNVLSLGGCCLSLVLVGFSHGPQALGVAVGWSVLTAVGPALLHIKDPNGMGGGDVKLAMLCGIGFGAAAPAVLCAAACMAVGVSLLKAMLLGRQVLREGVPFGPYFAAGALAALLAG
jgi:leader peptidase (prepilin peptidase) / N-methyltransferase